MLIVSACICTQHYIHSDGLHKSQINTYYISNLEALRYYFRVFFVMTVLLEKVTAQLEYLDLQLSDIGLTSFIAKTNFTKRVF